jgi:cell division protein FtsB
MAQFSLSAAGYNANAVNHRCCVFRFYDEQDFRILELIGQPRVWSNRLTVAAALVALVNFALNGTVEIERQAVLQEQRHRQRMIEQQKHNEELRKSNEELRKSNEELRKENERLAELESKLNEIWHS